MSEFVELRVGDHVGFLSGFPFSSAYFNGEKGVRLIRIRDLLGADDNAIYFSGPFDPRWLMKEGDVLIGMDGDFNIVRWKSDPALLNQRILKVEGRPNSEITHDYFYHWCGPRLLEIHARTAATTVKHLSVRDLERAIGKFPSVKDQRRIATILTTLDEVIEATEKLVEKHQQIKAGLMHDLFTRGLWTRPELARGDHHGLPCEATAQEGQLRPNPEEAPGLYQDSPVGPIPKAWDPCLLSDYLDPINGIKPGPFGSSLTKDIFTSSGFRIYGQEQVIAGDLEIGDYYISGHKFAEMRTFEVLEGDVLLSLVGTVGCVLVVEAPFEPGIINPRLLRLRPFLERSSPQFVRYLLLTNGLRKQIDSLAGGGTMPVINGKVIRRLRVPMISPDEQKLIITRLQSLEQAVTSTTTHLAKLRQQKQGLMHDLLTGRVRVDVACDA